MSTKIYNGFVFIPKDIVTINERLMVFRQKLDKYIRREFCSLAADVATSFIDSVACGVRKNEKNETPFLYAVSSLSQSTHEINNSAGWHPWDYSCSITIHPYRGSFYGNLFTNHKDIDKLWWEQRSLIKEYRYWDNTDPEEGVNYKSWKKRGEIWDEVLKEFHSIPNMNGFTAELTRDMYYYVSFDVDPVMSFIPNYESRLNLVSEVKLFDSFDQRKKDGKMEGFPSYYDWVKIGNPGFKELELMKKDCAKKIPKNITREMLIGK